MRKQEKESKSEKRVKRTNIVSERDRENGENETKSVRECERDRDRKSVRHIKKERMTEGRGRSQREREENRV